MQYLEPIISILNQPLNAIECKGRKKISGIAQMCREPMEGGKFKVYPAMVNSGEFDACVNPDDEYSLMIYHRALNIKSAAATTGKFGDSTGDVKLTANMSMVVFANAVAVGMTKESLAFYLNGIMQAKITGTDRPKNIKTIDITINEIVLNELQVFNEEYQQVDFFIGPEHIFLKVNYTIESTLSRSCFNTLCGK